MENRSMSLVELNNLVRRSIQACLPDEYWIQAELSEVRTNYSGHCYLEFIQKDPVSNALVAKARGIIWSSVFARLRPFFERETGQAFVSGIKVLVRVTVDFHELYGYSLTVVDIDPTYTLGDMARRRKEILRRLEEEGVLGLNKELPLPEPAQRVAVISSATAAGYGDFCNQLQHNAFGFVFYTKLFPAIMQGDRVEQSVISALEKIYSQLDRWDVVVIIRGGGATSDLSGFDTYELATHCAQFPLPIITGIGHERDDTVLDMISHTRVKTPTAAAEFLVNRMRESAERLEACADFLYHQLPLRIEKMQQQLDACVHRIPAKVQMRIQKEHFRQERLAGQLASAWQTRRMEETYRLEVMPRIMERVAYRLESQIHRLEMLEERVKASSPDLLLKKGYSLTLKNGKVVTSVLSLKPGDEVVTRVSDGQFKSKVL